MLRIYAFALLALLSAACSSTGGSNSIASDGQGRGGMVTYANPARNSSLSLVSESMLVDLGVPGDTPEERRLAFYSQKRESADVKVCSDEILDGVIEHLNNRGFGKYAVEGEEGAVGSQLDGSLSITAGGRTLQVVNSDDRQTDPDAKETYTQLLMDFTMIYSEVPQHQAVQGAVEFKQPEVSDKLKRATRGGNSGLMPGSIR